MVVHGWHLQVGRKRLFVEAKKTSPSDLADVTWRIGRIGRMSMEKLGKYVYVLYYITNIHIYIYIHYILQLIYIYIIYNIYILYIYTSG